MSFLLDGVALTGSFGVAGHSSVTNLSYGLVTCSLHSPLSRHSVFIILSYIIYYYPVLSFFDLVLFHVKLVHGLESRGIHFWVVVQSVSFVVVSRYQVKEAQLFKLRLNLEARI
jgi:hypothetical protein